MAQITITIPDAIEELIRTVAEDQKRPFSQLAADYLEIGFKADLENLNRMEIYKNFLRKRSKNPPPEQ